MRARHLEAAGADGNENGQARQYWAKYAAVSQRTKVKNLIKKNVLNFDYIPWFQTKNRPTQTFLPPV